MIKVDYEKIIKYNKKMVSLKRLEPYLIKDATHRLSCRHAIGRSGRNYSMDCIILGKTKSGKIKIIVFGDRYWKGHDDKKQIRYVDSYKLSEVKSTIPPKDKSLGILVPFL